MVEIGRFPGGRRVTGTAARSELAVVSVVLLVTGHTISRHTREGVVEMAACTRSCDMRPCQNEARKIVVESGRAPAKGGMTVIATRA
jgi:hypothetical protein